MYILNQDQIENGVELKIILNQLVKTIFNRQAIWTYISEWLTTKATVQLNGTTMNLNASLFCIAFKYCFNKK